MLVNDFDEKKIAKIFAHYAYRNTAVEDFHAGQSVIMDDEIYQKVYEIVAGKIRRIKRNHKMLLDFKSKEEVERALSEMYYPRAKEFFNYYNDMLAYAIFPYGSEWDEPILLKEDKKPKDLATYILSGAFLECCNGRKKMDDTAMCYINKDVYNRFYTLVCERLLWKDK